MSDLGTRLHNTVTPLATALVLLALGACGETSTAPTEKATDPGERVMAPAESVTAPSEIEALPSDSSPRVHQPNDKGATHARYLIPASSTPTGAPPASGRAWPGPRYVDERDNPPMPKGHREEEEEVNNGAAHDAYSTKQLLYHGAAVQTAPRIYLILWGPTWFTGGDTYGVANRLHYFYAGLGGSGWANVLKQFPSNYGSFTNLVGQYKGWRQDPSPVPAQPTKAQIAAAARRAATYFNDFSYNAQYVIATPWGVVDQFSTSKNFCAWHDWTAAGPTGKWVTYTSMPYMPYLDALGRGCGGGKVNGANGKLDGVTILASHEYGETVNDPGLGAYYDVDGDENADKCSWVNLANYRLANGYTFPVQPLWSNRYRTQYGNGCLYSQ